MTNNTSKIIKLAASTWENLTVKLPPVDQSFDMWSIKNFLPLLMKWWGHHAHGCVYSAVSRLIASRFDSNRCPRFAIHRIPVARRHKHRVLQVLASAKSHGPAGAETRLHDQTERLRSDNGDIRRRQEVRRDRCVHERRRTVGAARFVRHALQGSLCGLVVPDDFRPPTVTINRPSLSSFDFFPRYPYFNYAVFGFIRIRL